MNAAALIIFFLLGLVAPISYGHSLYQIDPTEALMKDMMIVEYWDRRINEKLPVTYNHLLQGGYWNMPSARMGCEGEIGFGFAWVPPYHTYNLRCQLIPQLEISGNYRVFRGVDDPILTPLGFGDLSDKGANVKVSLISPEDSDYVLPGVAIGLEDFLGTRNFLAKYFVFTQVFLDYNFELSLGYGAQRIRGLFGGFSWTPFRRSCNPLINGITFAAEYDATPYKDPLIEKHPKGRVKRSPINFGFKYRLLDYIDFSASWIRGTDFAFAASAFYNFGQTRGFLPKIDDPLPYKAPIVVEPIGPRRPEEAVMMDLLFAMRQQGLDLLEVTLGYDECQDLTMRMTIVNTTYHTEPEVRTRLNHLLAYLIPSNVDKVIVVVDANGFPIQEYHYYMTYLEQFREREMGPHELNALTGLYEVSWPYPDDYTYLFTQKRDLWNLEIYPKTHTFFGSAKGKFKYAAGLNFGLNGFIGDDIYYSLKLGWILASDLSGLRGIDRLNPSRLPNVRTDIVLYYQQKGITIDEAYLQKIWSLGKGWYTRAALGHFEIEYGGVASEALYYPLNSCWAIGAEGAFLMKRELDGLGFTTRVRTLDGFNPVYKNFRGSQYFLNFYYEWREAKLDFKIKAGKFLANDKGARWEVTRYFPSGLRISFWYTTTNGKDVINGKRYFDKGIAFSMPLDIFYTYSDLSRWGYGMSAWLRDVGVSAYTGSPLYDRIRENRN